MIKNNEPRLHNLKLSYAGGLIVQQGCLQMGDLMAKKAKVPQSTVKDRSSTAETAGSSPVAS